MIPIAHFPAFTHLRHLTLPYPAIIPHPKVAVSRLQSSALPDTLEHMFIGNAYPSHFLLEWLADVRGAKERQERLPRLERIDLEL